MEGVAVSQYYVVHVRDNTCTLYVCCKCVRLNTLYTVGCTIYGYGRVHDIVAYIGPCLWLQHMCRLRILYWLGLWQPWNTSPTSGQCNPSIAWKGIQSTFHHVLYYTTGNVYVFERVHVFMYPYTYIVHDVYCVHVHCMCSVSVHRANTTVVAILCSAFFTVCNLLVNSCPSVVHWTDWVLYVVIRSLCMQLYYISKRFACQFSSFLKAGD